jgi:hypothetical protein
MGFFARAAVLASLSLAALTFDAHAAGVYDRVPVKTTHVPPDRAFSAFLFELRDAVGKRDRAAVRSLIGKSFQIARDFGGMYDPKKTARQNFDVLFPDWSALDELMRASTFGPAGYIGKSVCGPAPLNAQSEKRIKKAAKQFGDDAGDTWIDWAYVDRQGVIVRSHPSNTAVIAARLSHEAVRVLEGGELWSKLALSNGDTGHVEAKDLIGLLNPRLCYAKTKLGWRIVGYVGGGD